MRDNGGKGMNYDVIIIGALAPVVSLLLMN